MSTEVTTSTNRKKSSSEKSRSQLSAAKVDHRKRRRNRTTQSCLNCHTSKRMCDRKRPACARCTQLGLTGLCVYEVDDPNQQPDSQDESSRLLKRVAELEGVIRELKNKPHPRWMSESSGYGQHGDDAGTSHLIFVKLSLDAFFTGLVSVFSDELAFSHSHASHIFSQSPQFSGYEDNAEMDQHLGSVSATFSPYSCNHDTLQPCSCIMDASNYQTMLELSLRLRKATRTLGQYPRHQAGGYCVLNQNLMELDALTANILFSVDSPHHTLPSYNQAPAPLPSSLPTTHHSFTHSTSRLDPWLSSTATDVNNAGSDSLMSWRPK
ncbi:hypothetical protein BT96DRAFT_990788 [Gymnopus androsaceus JB14]|uniref:Zn(2)-C6 fungal-type domain-containing protein n=1 Tax=Gymnopus androsaceus JB14 TaxID=1447944 RepID=A0A6A4HWT6_9AGAR|nr:hypothetical protein BT96DRAFT_990788 [Gymnopus androsaceus JB14]